MSKHISKSKEEPGIKTQPPKIPKSRLPVRAPSHLKKPEQDKGEKTKIQTRLSLSSNPTDDNDKKVEDSVEQKIIDDCFAQSPNIEPDGQKISDENAMSALTINSMKPLDEIVPLQPTQQKSEAVKNHMSPKVEKTEEEEFLQTAVGMMYCMMFY